MTDHDTFAEADDAKAAFEQREVGIAALRKQLAEVTAERNELAGRAKHHGQAYDDLVRRIRTSYALEVEDDEKSPPEDLIGYMARKWMEDRKARKKAEAECNELQHSFDISWRANIRGIKMWQKDHPGTQLTWPDKADLVAWLLQKRAFDVESAYRGGWCDRDDEVEYGLVAKIEDDWNGSVAKRALDGDQ